MGKVIGIDLGTTMSVMAVVDEIGRPKIIPNADGDTLTPSAVLIRGDERIVGKKARRSAVARPRNVAQLIKRHMSEEDWTFVDEEGRQHRPEELSALILKKLKLDAEQALGEPVDRAVITVPAYFGDLERNRTRQAGEIAGFEVLAIINEPTAAAIAYGIEKGRQNMTILVYDLGGGTFDVTVMQVLGNSELKVLASDGDKYLGGFDFDAAISEHSAALFKERHGVDPLADPQAYQDLIADAEDAKKELSSDTEAELYVSVGGKSEVVDLTRATFEEIIARDLKQTRTLTERVLSQPAAQKARIDRVLLVGGSTRIPCVQRLVQELVGVEPELGFNPDEVVALGAAAYAANLTGGVLVDSKLNQLPAIKVRDVTAHSLGVRVYNDQDKLENCIIIPKNSEVPVLVKYPDPFTTRLDNQTSVSMQVLQGESKDPELCTSVGEAALLADIPPQPKGVPQIEVTLGYDRSGMVSLHAQERGSGREIKASIAYTALLSAAELEQTADRVANVLKVK